MANEGTSKKGTLIKDTVILCVITLVAGLLLGLVYDITAPIIKDRRAQAKIDAFQAVFEIASEIVEDDEVNSKVLTSETVLSSNGYENIRIDEAMKAVDSTGNTLGYVVTVTTSNGYKGDITMTLGYSIDGIVTGLEYLTINETVGLGSKAKDPVFKNQIVDKQVNAFTLIKGKTTKLEEVQAISGATITSRAVTDAINASVLFIQQELIVQ